MVAMDMVQAPIRLTRRGRLVLLALLVALALSVVALAAVPGDAAAPPGGNPVVVVQPGDTLWSIAAKYAPARDRFELIDQIRRLNGVTDYTVQPGQRLKMQLLR